MFEALERSKARNRLKRAVEVTDSVQVLDFEVKGLLANHLCILSSGTFEECVRLHISEFSRTNAHAFVASFVMNRIKYITNLKSDKLVSLLGEFDASIALEIENYLDDRRKSALNSLVSLRHRIAHGKDPGSSLVSIIGYITVIYELLDKLEDIF